MNKHWSVWLLALITLLTAIAGCGGGGGSVNPNWNITATVTIQGRVNVPPAADPDFFAARTADKSGPSEYQYIPLTGASVTVAGFTAVDTTDGNGAFSLTLSYQNASPPFPIKITVTKGNIALKKHVTQAAAGLPVQVTAETTAVALAYDKLVSQGYSGLDIDDLEQKTYQYMSSPVSSIASTLNSYLSSGSVASLASPITQQNDVLSKVNALTDVTAPRLDSVAFSKSAAVPGESITATIRVKEKTGMSQGYIYLYFEDKQIEYEYMSDWIYDAGTDTWSTSATLAIPNYAPAGNYLVCLELRDSLYNWARFSSTQDEYRIPQTWSPYELTAKITPITVSSSSTDTTAPTPISATSLDSNITAADDTAVVRFTVSDDQSGMKSIYVWLERVDDGSGIEASAGESSNSCSQGAQAGQYVCDIEFDSSDFSATGTYKINNLNLTDNLANYAYYGESSLPDMPQITVSYAAVNTTGSVQLSNVTFSLSTASAGRSVGISMNIGYDARPKYVNIQYSKDGELNSNNRIGFTLKTTNNSEIGPWTFTDTETLNPYIIPGTYKALRFSIFSYTGDVRWENRYDRSNPEAVAFLDSLSPLVVTNNWKPDDQDPEVVSMALDGSSFQRGGSIKGSVTISDNGYPSYVSVTLRHQTSTKTNAYYSFGVYNCYPASTSGQWVCRFDETLPANLETGEWSVSGASPVDLASNVNYESDMNVTFTIY